MEDERFQIAGLEQETSSSLHENIHELRERARKHVKEAMRLIPMEQKMEYLEAIEKAPLVVEKETDSLQFVRRCDYNVYAATARLCLYWKKRKEYFGEDRFFLPLEMSGNGALTESDVRVLQAGFPALLPPTASGQQVILFDRRQWLAAKDTNSERVRCLFYYFQVLAEDSRSQTDGVLALEHLVMPRMYAFHEALTRTTSTLIRDVFPVKLHLHVVNTLPKTASAKLYMIQDLMATGVGVAVDIFGEDNVEVHIERQPGQLADELQELGMTLAGIPFHFGGSWKFDQVAQWCHHRSLVERQTYTPVYATLPLHLFPPVGPSTVSDDPEQSGQEEEEERRTKKRQANIIHSRRKRERRQQEFQTLKDETSQLEAVQRSLKVEKRRLEQLWDKAQRAMDTEGLPAHDSAVECTDTDTGSSNLTTDNNNNNYYQSRQKFRRPNPPVKAFSIISSSS